MIFGYLSKVFHTQAVIWPSKQKICPPHMRIVCEYYCYGGKSVNDPDKVLRQLDNGF